MKILYFTYLFTKTVLRNIRIYLWFNTLTQQLHTNSIPAPYLLRTKSVPTPLLAPRYRAEVKRRKYGHGTANNRTKKLLEYN